MEGAGRTSGAGSDFDVSDLTSVSVSESGPMSVDTSGSVEASVSVPVFDEEP